MLVCPLLQVWSRLECVCTNWPFLLFRKAADPSVFPDLRRKHWCCLDETFTEPFVAAFPGAEIEGPAATSLLRSLARHLHATNMHIERLISEFRVRSYLKRGRANVEAIHHYGLLGDTLKDFLAEGHPCPFKEDRAHLEKAGVALKQRARPDRHHSSSVGIAGGADAAADAADGSWRYHDGAARALSSVVRIMNSALGISGCRSRSSVARRRLQGERIFFHLLNHQL